MSSVLHTGARTHERHGPWTEPDRRCSHAFTCLYGLNFGPWCGACRVGGVYCPASLAPDQRNGGMRGAHGGQWGRAVLPSLGQRSVTGSDEDPRVTELRTAVSRLRRELAAHPAEFPDRGIAEDELASLAAMMITGSPEIPRLRRSLLLIAGAIGSVSALARGLSDVRTAVELFGGPPRR